MTTPGRAPSTAAKPDSKTVEFHASDEPVVLADRYRLGEVIGRGGMAEVYRADDLKLARLVAVKLLLEGAGDENDRERFISEARTLAMLSHSGLVTVLDAGFGTSTRQSAVTGHENDRPFLVMDLVDGSTLAQRMKDGPMRLDDLAPIAAQVADALAYVHDSGVVHRDVKPGNVLVGHDGTVKLADFGIARLVEQRSHHTATGVAIGTAAYIAPEQVNGGTVEGAADVYALGLVLLEAITGRREYGGAPAEAALARLQRPPEIPSLDPGWHELLTEMTALDPADRPSAAEVAVWMRATLTEPAPVGTVSMPDAATSPILAVSPQDHGSGPVLTKPMPDTGDKPAPTQPRMSPSDRSGHALARRVRMLAGRLRTLPSEVWGVAAAFGALVLLLIVLAVASGDNTAAPIPENTPAELREPLAELHEAVNEAEAPGLAAKLDDVDSAVDSGELAGARNAVDELVDATAQTLVAEDISDEQADQIFEASRDVLAELPEPAQKRN